MRTLMLLVLTVVAVSGLAFCQSGQKENGRSSKGRCLLKAIISAVDRLQNRSLKMHLNQCYVKDVVPNVGCSANHLCQAVTVMKNTTLNNSMLHRQLSAYVKVSGKHNCNVRTSSNLITMNSFLTNIKKCCQGKYSEA